MSSEKWLVVTFFLMFLAFAVGWAIGGIIDNHLKKKGG